MREDPRFIMSGLSTRRPRTCVCGVVFVAKNVTSRYCSEACRRVNTRYGRTYGQVEPKRLKVWRS